MRLRAGVLDDLARFALCCHPTEGEQTAHPRKGMKMEEETLREIGNSNAKKLGDLIAHIFKGVGIGIFLSPFVYLVLDGTYISAVQISIGLWVNLKCFIYLWYSGLTRHEKSRK